MLKIKTPFWNLLSLRRFARLKEGFRKWLFWRDQCPHLAFKSCNTTRSIASTWFERPMQRSWNTAPLTWKSITKLQNVTFWSHFQPSTCAVHFVQSGAMFAPPKSSCSLLVTARCHMVGFLGHICGWCFLVPPSLLLAFGIFCTKKQILSIFGFRYHSLLSFLSWSKPGKDDFGLKTSVAAKLWVHHNTTFCLLKTFFQSGEKKLRMSGTKNMRSTLTCFKCHETGHLSR